MANLDAERERIELSEEEIDDRVFSKHDEIVGEILFKMDEPGGPKTVTHVEFINIDDDPVVTQQAVMMTKRFFRMWGNPIRVDFLSCTNDEGMLEQSYYIEVDSDSKTSTNVS